MTSSSSADTPKVFTGAKVYQILLDFKVLMCSTGEPNDIYFSIYNADQKKFLTEEFMIPLTAQGLPEDQNKIGKARAVFKVFLFFF